MFSAVAHPMSGRVLKRMVSFLSWAWTITFENAHPAFSFRAQRRKKQMPHVKTILTIAVVALVVIWATNRNVFGVGKLVGSA